MTTGMIPAAEEIANHPTQQKYKRDWSMTNISTQRDGRGCEQTNESGNAPMLIAPSVSSEPVRRHIKVNAAPISR
jgi:hypothetical protein